MEKNGLSDYEEKKDYSTQGNDYLNYDQLILIL